MAPALHFGGGAQPNLGDDPPAQEYRASTDWEGYVYEAAEQDGIRQVLSDLEIKFTETLHDPDDARRRMVEAMQAAGWTKEEELFFEMYQAAASAANSRDARRRWSIFFREMDTRVKQAQIRRDEAREWERLYAMQDELRTARNKEDDRQADRLGYEIGELYTKLTRRPAPVSAGGNGNG